MLIANPIYDVVFKYLMEDIEIARDLIGLIVGRNIVELTLKPQETSVESDILNSSIKIYRLDFKAIIKNDLGKHEKILIELQKSKKVTDVMRFRNYLAKNYMQEDEIINEKGVQEIKPLPIVTIYFLGFPLLTTHIPVIKAQNCFYDVIRNERIDSLANEEFINLLNHESYTIQIPFLKNELQTRLEKVLTVFSQEYITEDKHQLALPETPDDPLAERLVRRLSRAAGNEQLRKKMDIEDEWQRIYNREFKQKDEIIVQVREENEQVKKENEEMKKIIEDLNRQLKNKK